MACADAPDHDTATVRGAVRKFREHEIILIQVRRPLLPLNDANAAQKYGRAVRRPALRPELEALAGRSPSWSCSATQRHSL
jgi:hypothetical protein